MTELSPWQVQLLLAVPVVRPHDRLPILTTRLETDPAADSATAQIIGVPGRYRIAAVLHVTAADATAAAATARRILQQSCAAARLPTGELISISVQPR